MKLDLLAFAAHPDDTELSCAGTLASHVSMGMKVGVIDLTRGEMGTRGTVEIRDKEARKSADILGLSVRENLGFADAFFIDDQNHQIEIIKKIRQYKPDIVLANAISDRHPDHGKAAKLTETACFLAGLSRIEVQDHNGKSLEAWRPRVVYHYIQSNFLTPDFIVDVSAFWDIKMEAIRAFSSQFHDPESTEPETFISSPEFMKLVEARGKEFGHSVGVAYGEGFNINRNIGVKNLKHLL